jgi:hypothetical protein
VPDTTSAPRGEQKRKKGGLSQTTLKKYRMVTEVLDVSAKEDSLIPVQFFKFTEALKDSYELAISSKTAASAPFTLFKALHKKVAEAMNAAAAKRNAALIKDYDACIKSLRVACTNLADLDNTPEDVGKARALHNSLTNDVSDLSTKIEQELAAAKLVQSKLAGGTKRLASQVRYQKQKVILYNNMLVHGTC